MKCASTSESIERNRAVTTPAAPQVQRKALDDVNIRNGAMQFLPGSHIRSVGHDRAGVLLDASDQVDASQAMVVDLPAGGVTLHHYQTLHHTAPNTTDRQRRAFAIHFMTPGTRRLADPGDLEVSFSRPMLRMRI